MHPRLFGRKCYSLGGIYVAKNERGGMQDHAADPPQELLKAL